MNWLKADACRLMAFQLETGNDERGRLKKIRLRVDMFLSMTVLSCRLSVSFIRFVCFSSTVALSLLYFFFRCYCILLDSQETLTVLTGKWNC